MTTMALTVPVTTTVTVSDAPQHAATRRRRDRIQESIAAYVALKLMLIGGVMSLAMFAGAVIGGL